MHMNNLETFWIQTWGHWVTRQVTTFDHILSWFKSTIKVILINIKYIETLPFCYTIFFVSTSGSSDSDNDDSAMNDLDSTVNDLDSAANVSGSIKPLVFNLTRRFRGGAIFFSVFFLAFWLAVYLRLTLYAIGSSFYCLCAIICDKLNFGWLVKKN